MPAHVCFVLGMSSSEAVIPCCEMVATVGHDLKEPCELLV